MRGYSAIGLNNCKDGLNVGHAMRACGCYDASALIVSGSRIKKQKNNLARLRKTDTSKSYKHIPLFFVDDILEMIPYYCTPIAVDLTENAVNIKDFKHPESAFYIFGAEDATLGKNITNKCADTIYIPTQICLNLAMTVNVVLFDRLIKNGE